MTEVRGDAHEYARIRRNTRKYAEIRGNTRFLFKKKAAKKTTAPKLEKDYGIFRAASLYRQPPKGRRLT